MNDANLDFDRIMETMSFLPDWEQRYLFLDELGDKLLPMRPEEQTDENRVFPCMSTVWVVPHRDQEGPDALQYEGFCDTPTIKGVVAILVALFSGKLPQTIIDTDTDAVFEELKLFDHLSPSRHVGVYAIVEKMKQQAAAYL